MAEAGVFSRSEGGKAAKYLFYSEPLVWVEGEGDKVCYQPLADRYSFRTEDAGGREECRKLIDVMKRDDAPFVVIVDGDYEVLARRRSWHRRAILLRRYSWENYVVHEAVLAHTVTRLTGNKMSVGEAKSWTNEFVGHYRSKLRRTLIMDIAKRWIADDEAVLPKRVEPLLERHDRFTLKEERVGEVATEARESVDRNALGHAIRVLRQWCKERRSVDIIPGHVVWGGFRRVVYTALRKAGMLGNVNDQLLLAVIVEGTWTRVEEEDHRRVREQVRDAVAEVRRIRRG